MINNIIPFIKSSQIDIIIALLIANVLLFFFLFITMINLSFFKSKYKKLNKGAAGFSYDDHILNNKREIDFLKKMQNDSLTQIDKIHAELLLTFSKVTLHKYNAFENQGGKLSFILVLLNNRKDGVILHNIHNNDFTYMYAKNVKNGVTEEALGKEEKEILLQTLNK